MKYLIGFVLLFLLLACNKRKDYYSALSMRPKILFGNGTDTINDSLKINGLPFTTSFNIEGEGKYNFTTSQNKGPDSLHISENTITIIGKTEGFNTVQLMAENLYKQKGTAQINLVVFKNLPPIPVILLEQVQDKGQYELKITATNSYDRDARFGGKIVIYEYKIDQNYTVQTPLSAIHYILNSPGIKKVRIRVQDNDGAWSSEITGFINIK